MHVFDSFKQGANRVAFEADRRLRLARAEANISGLKNAMRGQIAQLGDATYALYKQNSLADGNLRTLCEQIRATERQAEETQSQADRIRLESSPAPALLVGHVCLQCKVNLPAEAVFCPFCGGPASDISAAPNVQAVKTCPACGQSVPAQAKFCLECGAAVPVGEAPGEEDPGQQGQDLSS